MAATKKSTTRKTTAAKAKSAETAKHNSVDAAQESGSTPDKSAAEKTDHMEKKPSGSTSATKTAASGATKTTTTASAKTGDATSKTTPTEKTSGASAGKSTEKATDETNAKTAGDTGGTQAEQSSDSGSTGTSEPFHAPAPTPEAPPQRGAVGGMFMGGVIAALIGAVAAYFILPQLGFGANDQSAVIASLEDRTKAQDAAIADLRARLNAAEAASPEAPDLSGLEGDLSNLGAQVSALADRVAGIEARPVVTCSVSGADAQEDAELRAALQAQQAQVAALVANAEAVEEAARNSANAALRRAALTRIRTALDTGTAFEDALVDLQETGQDIPEALSRVAAEGVQTLPALQASYPDSARLALAAARAEDPEANAGTGVVGFLNNQLGVRSLEPREGSDTDAILSRAEAALREGRLGDALAEIDTLPAVAGTELAAWSEQAKTRMNALDAAETIGAELK